MRLSALTLLIITAFFGISSAQDTLPPPAPTPVQTDPAPAPAGPTQTPALFGDDEDLLIEDSGEETLMGSHSVPAPLPAKPDSAAAAPSSPVSPAAMNPAPQAIPMGTGALVPTDSPRRRTANPSADRRTAADSSTGTGSTTVSPLPSPANTSEFTTLSGAKIEESGAINFAQSNAKYRSPRRAMLLSLLLPGLGQAYAHSVPKSVAFFAAEAGLIAGGVAFKVSGTKKSDAAHAFADEHFSDAKFSTFTHNLASMAAANAASYAPGLDADSLLQAEIYGYPDYNGLDFVNYSAGRLASERYEFINVQAAGDLGWNLNNVAVQGWDDCEPLLPSSSSGWKLDSIYASGSIYVATKGRIGADTALTNRDTLRLAITRLNNDRSATGNNCILGFSSNQLSYQAKLKRAAEVDSRAQIFVFVLLANHIISAVDAFITARAYNDRLLLNKDSALNHIRLGSTFAYADDGSLKSSIALRVSF